MQKLLNDSVGSYVNVAILLLKSLARASSKKWHRNAFLISAQDVRDPGGNYLSQYEASPASEYLKSLENR